METIENNMNELYIPIRDHPKYEISNIGNIRNSKTKKILIQNVSAYGYYVVTLYNENVKSCFKVHRLIAIHFIAHPDNLQFIDHLNGNRIDNRIENLRWCCSQQNNSNRLKTTKKTSSIYKGVSFDKTKNKWHAYINKDRERQNIGYFDNERDAAIAYNNAAIELFGNFAKLNVISDDE